jgi:hypothetical protein
MCRKVFHWYRATCFGEPIAPWRESMRDMKRDLIARSLGSYDDYGTFFVTVPGGYERESAWADFDHGV